MKIVEQSLHIENQSDFSLAGISKFIEKCTRVSYQSLDKITDISYKKFVDNLIKNRHFRGLEFGTIHIKMYMKDFFVLRDVLVSNRVWNDWWIKYKYVGDVVFITTNFRYYYCTLLCYDNPLKSHGIELNALVDITPNKNYPIRYTVFFDNIERGVMDEFRTHIGLSHLAESTRYCVSGDTLLKYKNPHNHYTIKELWEDRQNKNRLSQTLIEVLNVNTGILEYSKIKNIFNNGIRKVYKITTELGYSLKCTSDHQIYTPNDWKSLSELKIGDKIYVNGIEGPIYQNKDWLEYHYLKSNKTVTEICKEFNFKPDVIRKWLHKYNIVKPKLEKQLYQDYDWLYNQNITLNKTFVDISKEFGFSVDTLKKWGKKLGIPNKGTGYFNVGRTPWNKGKSEFDDARVMKQAESLRTYHHNGGSMEKILKEDTSEYQKYIKSTCEICGTTKDLEVHHKDKNHNNNNPNNLMTVCSSCHQQIHNQSLTSLYGDKIIAITEIGEEEVFDLEIDNYHNYVANGIIVHNCNYSKDKFDNEITFIIPNWVNTKCPNKEQEGPSSCDLEWSNTLLNAEASYMSLLKKGWTPQQARTILPLGIKSTLVSCGFKDAWTNFINQRKAADAHPLARELAVELNKKLNIK